MANCRGAIQRARGEPVYVVHGVGLPHLPLMVGLMIVASALVSRATIANGFASYLHQFVEVPRMAAAHAGYRLRVTRHAPAKAGMVQHAQYAPPRCR